MTEPITLGPNSIEKIASKMASKLASKCLFEKDTCMKWDLRNFFISKITCKVGCRFGCHFGCNFFSIESGPPDE